MAGKTAGQKRAEARAQNRDMRGQLEAMTNQQLKHFFGGFDATMTGRIENTLAKVREDRADEELKDIEAQIEALKAKHAELKKQSK